MRLAYSLFAILSLAIAALSMRLVVLPLHVQGDFLLHYLPNAKLGLYMHLIGAPAALALMPFQFSNRLRARRPRLHRVTGYGYVISILIGALGAFLMFPHFEGSMWALIGFCVLNVAWVYSTVRALNHARARQFAEHRIWMMRSAAFTSAAITLRLIMPFLMLAGWPILDTYEVTGWASWILNLAIVEFWLLRRSRNQTLTA